jgi:hypothetical protein
MCLSFAYALEESTMEEIVFFFALFLCGQACLLEISYFYESNGKVFINVQDCIPMTDKCQWYIQSDYQVCKKYKCADEVSLKHDEN